MSLERALAHTARACTALGALALAVMMLSTSYDVVARTLFRAPLHGAVDIVEMMVLCSAFLGLPEICLRDEQIRVDIVDSFVPPSVLAALKVLALLATIVFLGILAANVTHPMMDSWRFGDIKADTGFPTYPLYALTLFTLVAALAATAVVLIRTFRAKPAAQP
ncbi:TRAP transporter small permease [Undibacter mobilis]|uniref:TRAP transporter small permease protein n=1 Tax=Undibacter mobilis TaxID=2292256 RepID=A0A371B7K8_9BRAD|nr:TRAP transporter small permease [Undibacter mobilis]RDV03576.1 TRAP transporter small permease [Undibacter mobilis]